MKTIDAVRRRFDELLFERIATAQQVDVTLCEDGATAMFYCHLSDGDALAVSLDLTAEAVAEFDSHSYAAALSSLCDWTVH